MDPNGFDEWVGDDPYPAEGDPSGWNDFDGDPLGGDLAADLPDDEPTADGALDGSPPPFDVDADGGPGWEVDEDAGYDGPPVLDGDAGYDGPPASAAGPLWALDDDLTAQDTSTVLDDLVGADPHALPEADHDGADPFPPHLDFADTLEPVDGFPWSDPDTLGDPGEVVWQPPDASADLSDLVDYAGTEPGGDPAAGWAALLGDDDPATSMLARWWGPAG